MFCEMARWRVARPATALRSATLVTSSNKGHHRRERPVDGADEGADPWPRGGRALATEFFVTGRGDLSRMPVFIGGSAAWERGEVVDAAMDAKRRLFRQRIRRDRRIQGVGRARAMGRRA